MTRPVVCCSSNKTRNQILIIMLVLKTSVTNVGKTFQLLHILRLLNIRKKMHRYLTL